MRKVVTLGLLIHLGLWLSGAPRWAHLAGLGVVVVAAIFVLAGGPGQEK